MRGTSEHFLEELAERKPQYQFPSELRAFLERTLQSPAAEEMRRFKAFVEPGSIFPYEGTLKSHSYGSYLRGNWALHDERALRHTYHHPSLWLSPWQSKLHKLHDLGEHGLPEDPLVGLKTEDDRERERLRFQELAETVHVSDPQLYAQLQWILRTTDHRRHQETVAGRFWKNVVEQVGNVETARRLHERLFTDQNRDETAINADTHIYVHHSVRVDPDGQPLQPRLIGSQAAIADILANAGAGAIKAAREFLSVRRYLWRHQDQFRSLYQEYLLEAETNAQLFGEICAMKQHTAAAAQHRTRQAASEGMLAYLDRLSTLSLDEALSWHDDGLTPLAEGRMVLVGPEQS